MLLLNKIPNILQSVAFSDFVSCSCISSTVDISFMKRHLECIEFLTLVLICNVVPNYFIFIADALWVFRRCESVN